MSKTRASYAKIDKQYPAALHKSTEGSWRLDLNKPLSITTPPNSQIAHLYKHAILTEVDTAAARMHGYSPADSMVGLKLSDILVEEDSTNRHYLLDFVTNKYHVSGVESHERDKNGEDKYFLSSLIGTVENDKLISIRGIQQDITDQKHTIHALQRSEERLNMALKVSSTGLWEWDVATDNLYWSPELREIYGVSPDEIMTYEKYMAMIHPEDRNRVERITSHSMQTGETYQFEHRIIRRDDTEHWLLGTGRAYLENGKPVRMIGTSMNIDLVKQAQELKTANSQLRTQRAELLALNKAKDEFIALASHQLRTPATAVKQYISLLISEAAGPISGDQLQFLQVAFDSNERQLRIINDLLKTAQIDSSMYTLTKQSYDFVEIIQFAIDELASAFDLKRQKVEVSGPDSAVIPIDVAELKLVIVNLLENASKYSYPDSEIKISIKKSGKHLQVSIADQGVGIMEKDIKRIFDKFTRVNNDLSDTVTGTGLGLYWVKRIVDLHDGSIKVTSKPGVGSVFSMRLPYE